MSCAFRIHGDFVWPPAVHTVSSARQKGIVEIHVSEQPDGAADTRPCKAWLRWLPDGVPPVDPPPVPDETENVYAVPDAAALFRPDKAISLWIFSPDTATVGKRLCFRGATRLEQRSLSGADNELLWPLVDSCHFKTADAGVYSELIIGQSDNDSFRLNLLLPMPFGQTTLTASGALNPDVLPFSVLYSPCAAMPDGMQIFHTLVCGAASPGNGNFQLLKGRYPAIRKLGAFSFCAGGDMPADRNAVIYRGEQTPRRDRYGNPVPTIIDGAELGLYWPSLVSRRVWDVFERLGFAIPKATLPYLVTSLDDVSVRFGGTSKKPQIIYRIVLTAPNEVATKGPIRWSKDGGFRLRLDASLGGGWLETGSRSLTLEVTTEYRDNGDALIPFVAVDLFWTQAVSIDAGQTSSQPGTYTSGLLQAAGVAFGTLRRSLRQVEGGMPHSFLPDWTTRAGAKAPFQLRSPFFPAQRAGQALSWGRGKLPGEVLRLSLSSVNPDGSLYGGLEVASTLPGFLMDGKTMTWLLQPDEDWLKRGEQDDWLDDEAFASFRVQPKSDLAPVTGRSTLRGRLSSLQFTIANGDLLQSPNAEKRHWLRLGARRGRGSVSNPEGFGYPDTPLSLIDLQLVLSVAKVEPVTVDQARGDRTSRALPLLIAPDKLELAADAIYHLEVREKASALDDRLLMAFLYENEQGSDSSPDTYVVLAQEPFSLMRMLVKRLGDRGDASNQLVATYSSDERIWNLKQVADTYHYSLPPQVAGESMDKPRRLELHDLPDAPSGDSVIRPYASSHQDGTDDAAAAARGHLQRRAVEFQLTPSAEMWIRPSDVERGYLLPEWQGYDIFRQRGELGLGAALRGLRAEFLYGLAVGVETALEPGPARNARVAELDALLGRTLSPNDQEITGAKRWVKLSRAIARRPERLEIWAHDPDHPMAFAPANFQGGVSFALRSTALHRAPTQGFEDAAALLAPPRTAVGPASPIAPRYHPQGLSGGALWPIEQRNLFERLLVRPQSSGGEIASIALSPQGGDAVQTARFLDGQVSIISKTEGGFVSRVQVEVIGRIAALWHHAKHVVVYERTVSPSAQFAPTRAEDPEKTRTRRPVLRKVREYVELLQPERSYPDFAEAKERMTGFLEKVRFNTRIINVDSAWARDVGTDGWEIPLWNRRSAAERPQVYAMPDVSFVTTAEGNGETPSVAQESRDPDHLYFFAQFTDGSADTDTNTDSWASRIGIDTVSFDPGALARALTPSAPSSDANRNAGRFLPGLRRFTWRLAAAGQKTMMNAGWADKPVYVGLESVTFLREAPKRLTANHGIALAAKVALDSRNATASLAGYWTDADGSGGPDGSLPFSEGMAAFKALLAAGQAGSPPSVADIADLKHKIDTLWMGVDGSAGLKRTIAERVIPGADTLLGAVNAAQAIAADGHSVCESLMSDAGMMIKRKTLLILENLKSVETDAQGFLMTLKADLRKVVDQLTPDQFPYTVTKDDIAVALSDLLKPVFDEASDDVGRMGEGVERVRAILTDAAADTQAVLQRARMRVGEVSRTWDRDKPWSPSRIAAFEQALRTSVARVSRDVVSAAEEARHRLGVEGGVMQAAFSAHVGNALSGVVAGERAALEGLCSLRLFIAQRCTDLRSEIARLSNGQDGVLDRLDTRFDLAAEDLINAGLDPAIEAAGRAVLDEGKATLARLVALSNDITGRVDHAEADVTLTAASAMETVSILAADMIGAVTQSAAEIAGLMDRAAALGEVAQEIVVACVSDLSKEIDGSLTTIDAWARSIAKALDAVVDPMVQETLARIDAAASSLQGGLASLLARLLPLADEAAARFAQASAALRPSTLRDTVIRPLVLTPVCEQLFDGMSDPLVSIERDAIDAGFETLSVVLEKSHHRLQGLSEAVRVQLETLKLPTFGEATKTCESLAGGAETLMAYLRDGTHLETALSQAKTAFDQSVAAYQGAAGEVQALLDAVGSFDRGVRALHNDVAAIEDSAKAYVDRALEAVGAVADGPLETAPGRLLKLYSAVTSSPELGALKCDVDLIRATYDDLSDVIVTTRANAVFDQMGDGLRALGLTIPFDGVGKYLNIADQDMYDIPKLIGSLGGMDFAGLFKGCMASKEAMKGVRISHDFDRAQALAWVEIDLNIPLDGRNTLFSMEVFSAICLKTRLKGRVRLEASKDSDRLEQTGFGRIETDLEMAVAGQPMVTFEKLAIHFTRETGLNVEFDPKNIRLSPSLQFVQDYLADLFPDTLGALKVIKRNGIPVGIEHEFAMPPISLNAGTSGVQNIQIANHFELVAFPDFRLSNRFNLSRPDAPFIFSIFVIGGTGYVQIDADYQPIGNILAVTVEAAVGGSASLAFSFGPFVGQVYITFSVALSYRKVSNGTGSGLTIAAILLIVGNVSVCGIATVNITLMLRMTYRETGAIEAQGTLSVTIRISSFFKITARAAITYTMRDGKSQTQTSGSIEHEVTDDRFKKAKQAAEKIKQARG